MSSPLRVVHADPRRIVRDALSTALPGEPGIEVVASTQDPTTTLLQAQRTRAEVVLVAAVFNGQLPALCGQLRRLDPRPRTLVLDGAADQDALLRTIEAGADGYLDGSAGLAGLADAVRALARGESVVPPAMLGPLLRRLIQRRREASQAAVKLNRLTPREREVLGLLVDGYDADAIAGHLVISPETVRTHIQRTLRKLEVRSRLEAITLAARSDATERVERIMEDTA